MSEIFPELEKWIEKTRHRIERTEEQMNNTSDPERRQFLLGYVIGSLRAKWEIQDLIREIKHESGGDE